MSRLGCARRHLCSRLIPFCIGNSLLGHYGTTGGLSLAYCHAQALIRRKGEEEGVEPKMIFVTGPGHGGEQPAFEPC